MQCAGRGRSSPRRSRTGEIVSCRWWATASRSSATGCRSSARPTRSSARHAEPAAAASLRRTSATCRCRKCTPAAHRDEFALLLTGDGGWAGLDQELAARLAASGVPTVGLNSLKYFWTRAHAGRRPRATSRASCATTWRLEQEARAAGGLLLRRRRAAVRGQPPAGRPARAHRQRQPARHRRQCLLRGAGCRVGRAATTAARRRGPSSRASGSCRCCACTGEGEKDSICPGLPRWQRPRASRSAPATTSAASTPRSPSASSPSPAAPRPVT